MHDWFLPDLDWVRPSIVTVQTALSQLCKQTAGRKGTSTWISTTPSFLRWDRHAVICSWKISSPHQLGIAVARAICCAACCTVLWASWVWVTACLQACVQLLWQIGTVWWCWGPIELRSFRENVQSVLNVWQMASSQMIIVCMSCRVCSISNVTWKDVSVELDESKIRMSYVLVLLVLYDRVLIVRSVSMLDF